MNPFLLTKDTVLYSSTTFTHSLLRLLLVPFLPYIVPSSAFMISIFHYLPFFILPFPLYLFPPFIPFLLPCHIYLNMYFTYEKVHALYIFLCLIRFTSHNDFSCMHFPVSLMISLFFTAGLNLIMQMCYMFFTHSSVNRHLSCFCMLAIMNDIAVNTYAHVSLWCVDF